MAIDQKSDLMAAKFDSFDAIHISKVLGHIDAGNLRQDYGNRYER